MSSNRYEPGVLCTPEYVNTHVYKMHATTVKIEVINSTNEIKRVKFEGAIQEELKLEDIATRFCFCNPVVAKFREESNKDQTIEFSDQDHLTREIKISDPFTQRFHIYKIENKFSLAEKGAMVTVQAPNFDFPTPVKNC